MIPPTFVERARAWWADFLDRLLGPKCPRCAQRVFTADRPIHDQDCD